MAITIQPLTPSIGAELGGIDFSESLDAYTLEGIYRALIEHLVVFIRETEISPSAHLDFASSFGTLDEPHLHYPHVPGFERIVELENDGDRPPDTNSWHTDLTFKRNQPFASVLVARDVPNCGGDTLWSSNYAAYDRLPNGMQLELESLSAVHDLGDFRNSVAQGSCGEARGGSLDRAVPRFGHNVRPLVGIHPVSGRKFLNFNEAFVSHILGMTTNDSNALRTYLANHMNKPEDQVRWRWQAGDLVVWDNRVTMHYANADYMPHYRRMHRVTVVDDQRVASAGSS